MSQALTPRGYAFSLATLLALVFPVTAQSPGQHDHSHDGHTHCHHGATRQPATPSFAEATVPVILNVVDHDGSATFFRVTFTDSLGQVFPATNPSERQLPDLWFQDHVYRKTGDVMALPVGTYDVVIARGPEYLTETRMVTALSGAPVTITHVLQRWIDPASRGYFSGDHHVHGSGCQYFQQVPEVTPADLMPQVTGEGLHFTEVLIWSAKFESQVQYFSATPRPESTLEHVLKYDLEISGFGSGPQGHDCLLGLSDVVYPGSTGRNGWPTWARTTLKWAKDQGGITGQAHGGLGLYTGNDNLPNYNLPGMNSFGAMEFFVNVTQDDLIDFYGVGDANVIGELNGLYHVLNSGYRVAISGESDFPCTGGDRVGQARVYVKMNAPAAGQQVSYTEWTDGIEKGRCYVSDGRTHLLDFEVDSQAVGEGNSEVLLPAASEVRVECTVAAMLPATPEAVVWQGWNVERARQPNREIAVEIVMNGIAVHRQLVPADGRDVAIDRMIPIHKSSWVAVRVLGAAHTNPIFVIVDGEPIRASKDSARWCKNAVNRYWAQRSSFLAAGEIDAARAAKDLAISDYQDRTSEASVGPFADTESYGTGCFGTFGFPSIIGAKEPQIGAKDFAIGLLNGAPDVSPVLLVSRGKGNLRIGSCSILLESALWPISGAPKTDAGGVTQIAMPVPNSPELEGLELYFQWLVPDPYGQGGGFTLSDGLAVHFSATESPN